MKLSSSVDPIKRPEINLTSNEDEFPSPLSVSYLSGFQGFNSRAVIPPSPYTGARLPPPRPSYRRKIYPHVTVLRVRIGVDFLFALPLILESHETADHNLNVTVRSEKIYPEFARWQSSWMCD